MQQLNCLPCAALAVLTHTQNSEVISGVWFGNKYNLKPHNHEQHVQTLYYSLHVCYISLQKQKKSFVN